MLAIERLWAFESLNDHVACRFFRMTYHETSTRVFKKEMIDNLHNTTVLTFLATSRPFSRISKIDTIPHQ